MTIIEQSSEDVPTNRAAEADDVVVASVTDVDMQMRNWQTWNEQRKAEEAGRSGSHAAKHAVESAHHPLHPGGAGLPIAPNAHTKAEISYVTKGEPAWLEKGKENLEAHEAAEGSKHDEFHPSDKIVGSAPESGGSGRPAGQGDSEGGGESAHTLSISVSHEAAQHAAKGTPEEPSTEGMSETEKAEREALKDRFKWEGHESNFHGDADSHKAKKPYDPDPTLKKQRYREYIRGYVRSRLDARSKNMSKKDALEMSEAHLQHSHTLTKNEPQARHRGAANGYLAHAVGHHDEHDWSKGVPGEKVIESPFEKGSEEHQHFAQGHTKALGEARSSGMDSERASHRASIHHEAAASDVTATEKAMHMGAAKAFEEHAASAPAAKPIKVPSHIPEAHHESFKAGRLDAMRTVDSGSLLPEESHAKSEEHEALSRSSSGADKARHAGMAAGFAEHANRTPTTAEAARHEATRVANGPAIRPEHVKEYNAGVKKAAAHVDDFDLDEQEAQKKAEKNMQAAHSETDGAKQAHYLGSAAAYRSHVIHGSPHHASEPHVVEASEHTPDEVKDSEHPIAETVAEAPKAEEPKAEPKAAAPVGGNPVGTRWTHKQTGESVVKRSGGDLVRTNSSGKRLGVIPGHQGEAVEKQLDSLPHWDKEEVEDLSDLKPVAASEAAAPKAPKIEKPTVAKVTPPAPKVEEPPKVEESVAAPATSEAPKFGEPGYNQYSGKMIGRHTQKSDDPAGRYTHYVMGTQQHARFNVGHVMATNEARDKNMSHSEAIAAAEDHEAQAARASGWDKNRGGKAEHEGRAQAYRDHAKTQAPERPVVAEQQVEESLHDKVHRQTTEGLKSGEFTPEQVQAEVNTHQKDVDYNERVGNPERAEIPRTMATAKQKALDEHQGVTAPVKTEPHFPPVGTRLPGEDPKIENPFEEGSEHSTSFLHHSSQTFRSTEGMEANTAEAHAEQHMARADVAEDEKQHAIHLGTAAGYLRRAKEERDWTTQAYRGPIEGHTVKGNLYPKGSREHQAYRENFVVARRHARMDKLNGEDTENQVNHHIELAHNLRGGRSVDVAKNNGKVEGYRAHLEQIGGGPSKSIRPSEVPVSEEPSGPRTERTTMQHLQPGERIWHDGEAHFVHSNEKVPGEPQRMETVSENTGEIVEHQHSANQWFDRISGSNASNTVHRPVPEAEVHGGGEGEKVAARDLKEGDAVHTENGPRVISREWQPVRDAEKAAAGGGHMGFHDPAGGAGFHGPVHGEQEFTKLTKAENDAAGLSLKPGHKFMRDLVPGDRFAGRPNTGPHSDWRDTSFTVTKPWAGAKNALGPGLTVHDHGINRETAHYGPSFKQVKLLDAPRKIEESQMEAPKPVTPAVGHIPSAPNDDLETAKQAGRAEGQNEISELKPSADEAKAHADAIRQGLGRPTSKDEEIDHAHKEGAAEAYEVHAANTPSETPHEESPSKPSLNETVPGNIQPGHEEAYLKGLTEGHAHGTDMHTAQGKTAAQIKAQASNKYFKEAKKAHESGDFATHAEKYGFARGLGRAASEKKAAEKAGTVAPESAPTTAAPTEPTEAAVASGKAEGPATDLGSKPKNNAEAEARPTVAPSVASKAEPRSGLSDAVDRAKAEGLDYQEIVDRATKAGASNNLAKNQATAKAFQEQAAKALAAGDHGRAAWFDAHAKGFLAATSSQS